ncbi:hypothetical protein ARMGADRAFT_1163716 [Armillaria gallica]|uniref:Uncharacterized protein n=1 Tax=Armillaria gallica TaxID=47427 RepID=A0A2H3DLV4_ARMGA|nr:hypothetical protein ARMGADRAFT_1163716 [Armillaria gallica]
MQASPPDLSQDDMDIIFCWLDVSLNRMILQALLHGKSIPPVTLWVIYSSPKRLRSTFVCTIIIALYVLSTIEFGSSWVFGRRGFIEYGDNYHSIFTTLSDHGIWWIVYYLIAGITGGISTHLVDVTIIWRCWALWERQWRMVFVPIICTAPGTVMKAMQIFGDFHSTNNISTQFAADVDWSLIYVVLILATTVMCTFLIVYRIVRHAPGMSTSRKIIEMLIQSSAMYSISLIVYLALVSRNSESGIYADIIAAYVRAIAPTLLVGRISAHANASARRQKMVAMWENHPPLVGCFREEVNDNNHGPDDGHQTVSGSSMGKETTRDSVDGFTRIKIPR